MKSETNDALELAREESSYGLETKNIVANLLPEIQTYFKASLAEISERDLHYWCYRANVSVASKVYRFLLLRRKLALAGIASAPHHNF
jgi:hypothetical protein